MPIHLKALSVALVVAMTALTLGSCHTGTSTASIAGTWTLHSAEEHYYVNGVSTKDTTGIDPTGANFTLRTDGTFIGGTFFGGTGTYTYHNSLLTIVSPGTYGDFNVTKLDAHTLSLMFTDTITTNPLKTDDITYSFTR